MPRKDTNTGTGTESQHSNIVIRPAEYIGACWPWKQLLDGRMHSSSAAQIEFKTKLKNLIHANTRPDKSWMSKVKQQRIQLTHHQSTTEAVDEILNQRLSGNPIVQLWSAADGETGKEMPLAKAKKKFKQGSTISNLPLTLPCHLYATDDHPSLSNTTTNRSVIASNPSADISIGPSFQKAHREKFNNFHYAYLPIDTAGFKIWIIANTTESDGSRQSVELSSLRQLLDYQSTRVFVQLPGEWINIEMGQLHAIITVTRQPDTRVALVGYRGWYDDERGRQWRLNYLHGLNRRQPIAKRSQLLFDNSSLSPPPVSDNESIFSYGGEFSLSPPAVSDSDDNKVELLFLASLANGNSDEIESSLSSPSVISTDESILSGPIFNNTGHIKCEKSLPLFRRSNRNPVATECCCPDLPSVSSNEMPEETCSDEYLEYEVEKILDSRFYYRKLQYLIKWKGYGAKHNSWEPAEHLENADNAVRKFHENFPNRPSPFGGLCGRKKASF